MGPGEPAGLHWTASNPGDACLQISLGFIIRRTCLRKSDKIPSFSCVAVNILAYLNLCCEIDILQGNWQLLLRDH